MLLNFEIVTQTHKVRFRQMGRTEMKEVSLKTQNKWAICLGLAIC